MFVARYNYRRLDTNILQALSTRLLRVISSYRHIWCIPLCLHCFIRLSKTLMITSRKQISPFSKFTLALIFITYMCKISVSNTCVIEDVLCVLSDVASYQLMKGHGCFGRSLCLNFRGLAIQSFDNLPCVGIFRFVRCACICKFCL